MKNKIDTRVLYIGDEEQITDLIGSILSKTIKSVMVAYNEDNGKLIFFISKPKIVILNIKRSLYANEKIASTFKQFNQNIVVISIYDKVLKGSLMATQAADFVMYEPLNIEDLLNIIKTASSDL